MSEAELQGASAPAESSTAELAPEPQTANPLTDTNQAIEDKAAEKEALSVRAAIKKADEELKAKAEEKPAKDEAKDEKPEKPVEKPKKEAKAGDASAEPSDPPDQAAQEGQQDEKPSHYAEPPNRFHEAAKAEWASAPESVRAEVHRALHENEQGIQKYKESAERYEGFREFDEMARQANVDPKGQLREYVGIAQLLQRDFVSGLDTICRNAGTSLNQVVQTLAGQTPDEARQRDTSTINQLRQQVSQLQQQVKGVNTTIEEQRRQSTRAQIADFARSNPRFDELSGEIGRMLKTGYASDLKDAYEKADRLNPGPQSRNQPLKPAQDDSPALKPPGRKSISGAPAPDAPAPGQKRRLSRKEAIDAAAREIGA